MYKYQHEFYDDTITSIFIIILSKMTKHQKVFNFIHKGKLFTTKYFIGLLDNVLKNL